MKIEYIDDSAGKKYVYNENFWTGKKELTIDGVFAEKVSKKEVILPETDGKRAVIKGNFIAGVKLLLSDGQEIVLYKNKWYEWLFIFLPILNMAIGVFGGAIGGGLSGLFGMMGVIANAMILKTELNFFIKIICCIAILALSFFAWFFIYAMIVGGLALAFPSLFS